MFDKIIITIEDIIFTNSDNGYYVFNADYNGDLITCNGYFIDIIVGMKYEISGTIKQHNIYGEQYEVTQYKPFKPSNTNQIRDYLASGLFRGIGLDTANRIIDKFGDKALDIIKEDSEQLLKVSGIGKKTYDKIMLSYKDLFESQESLIFLTSLGLSIKQSKKIYNEYGSRTKEVINDNPFSIIKNIEGIGFKTIDKISNELSIEKNSIQRVCTIIIYTLQQEANNGHMYLTREQLFNLISKHILNDKNTFDYSIEELLIQGDIYVDDSKIYHINMHNCEIGIVQELIRILNATTENLNFNENFSNIELTQEQLDALNSAFEDNIFILTGGPGTGKTTILKELVYRLKSIDKIFSLAAPTGRAANRLEEVVGYKASTIHRLLEYSFVEDMNFLMFNRNSENQLDSEVIIIDEVSMVDAFLFYRLLLAIKTGTRLILIGDSNQLPSVGAGNILWDLINSELIKTMTLTKIHRQAQGSLIVRNAHAILNDEKLKVNQKDKDFFFIESNSQLDIMKTVVDLSKNRFPKYYNINPIEDITILTPMKKGLIGSIALNEQLQNSLNNQNEKKFLNMYWLNDKVMQVKNNYTLAWIDINTLESSEGVFNGEIGTVASIGKDSLSVIYANSKKVVYTKQNINDITLSYAMTIHKSQGNEFDYCIIPLYSLPRLFRNKNLIYTAITRAKKNITIVGSVNAFNEMIRSENQIIRNSGLCDRIKLFK